MAHSDNDGRRHSLRSALSNDPVYRRIKDLLLGLLAIGSICAHYGFDPIDFVKGRPEPIPTAHTETQQRIWQRLDDAEKRLNTNEQAIALIQASLSNLKSGQDDMRQDVRELLRQELSHGH